MSDNNDVRYVPLQALFPYTHRSTLHRWGKQGKIPKPDLVINNRKYYRTDRRFDAAADAEPVAKREAATA
jgi:hypothetical protein